MAKQANDWIKGIQQGKGKEIARAFFLTYTTQSELSRKLYEKSFERIIKQSKRKDWIHKTIQTYHKEWKALNFFDYANRQLEYRIPNKKGKGRKEHNQKYDFPYTLNLEPLFKYCKEKREIEFTDEEKRALWLWLYDIQTREAILKQFPDEDIINAILKYYVKNFIIQYDKSKIIINENLKGFKKKYGYLISKRHQGYNEREKALKYLSEKHNFPYKKETDEEQYFDFFLIEQIEKRTLGFGLYKQDKRKNPSFVLNIDFKMLKALNLCSDLLMDLKEIVA